MGIDYKYQGENRQLTFRFLSEYLPVVKDGKVYIEDTCLACNKDCLIETRKWDFKGYGGEEVSAYTIDFIFEKFELLEAQFVLTIEKK